MQIFQNTTTHKLREACKRIALQHIIAGHNLLSIFSTELMANFLFMHSSFDLTLQLDLNRAGPFLRLTCLRQQIDRHIQMPPSSQLASSAILHSTPWIGKERQ